MRKFSSLMCAGLVLVLVLSLFGGALAAPAGERVEVLIGFHGQPNPGLVRAFDGEVVHEFSLIPTIHAMLPAQAAAALSRHPSVSYVEASVEMHAVAQTIPWGVSRIEAPATWTVTTGYSIGVAVLDTGIASHLDLPEIAGGTNTVDSDSLNYVDGHGHGTHVAGTVAALNNDYGVVGVAPGAALYAVKVLSDSGSGTDASVAKGIEWAVKQGNIKVINMSLSGGSTTTLANACQAAYNAGVLLIAAAGNSGNAAGRGDNVGYPAAYSSVVAVAASDSADKRASFSSTGPAVELIAPGVSIPSTYTENRYATASGTSMASPHVAGVAALVWGKNPELANTEVRTLLIENAQDLGLRATHQGHGLVRADWAVAATPGAEPGGELGSIAGKVFDSSAAGLDGATVTITGLGLSATTSADGTYSLPEVPAGTYTVTAAASGYATETSEVKVEAAQTTMLNFTLQKIPTYTVSGTVRDGAGSGIVGALVAIAGTDKAATTDASGAYSINGIAAGSYTITASKQGYYNQSKDVSIEANTTVDFALTAAPPGPTTVSVSSIGYNLIGGKHLRVIVTVVDNQDARVSGATVSAALWHGGSVVRNFAGTTGSDGTVTFAYNHAPNGTYTTQITDVVANGLKWDGQTPDNEFTK